MEKQISFQGVSLNPYGDISPDGELSACVNLQSHGGALRPSVLEGTEYQISVANLKLITIHATSNYRHMILYDGKTLFWTDEASGVLQLQTFASVEKVISIQTIGNTLSILSDKGIEYALFRNNSYVFLGELPEIYLDFGLYKRADNSRGHFVSVSIDTIRQPGTGRDFSDNNSRLITDAVMSVVNTLVKETYESGRFVFPFFVRYALRLYNGDLIRHSAPLFMNCISPNTVFAFCNLYKDDREVNELLVNILRGEFTLNYKWLNNLETLSDWSDIIKSVDVFISEPIYTYSPDGLIQRFVFSSIMDKSYSVCRSYEKRTVEPDDTYLIYKKRSAQELLEYSSDGIAEGTFNLFLKLPYKTVEEISKEIESTSNFYLLSSIPVSELQTTMSALPFEQNALSNISFKERMTDDYNSHNKFKPTTAFVYNRRLNIGNIEEELTDGPFLESALIYQDATDGETLYTYECFIYADIDGSEVIFKMPGSISISDELIIDYLFFPYSMAKKAVFVRNDGMVVSLTLSNHLLLNGVYYFSRFTKNTFIEGASPVVKGSRIMNFGNTIYTSQIDNPFYFPVEGVNTVGTGEIIGLSSITTALSQGQFGTFPLMAFCTDGNYALQVNSEGLFSSVSPMQRDVCTNPASITQIDGAIVFVSAKGVMLANGSQIQCISAALDGVYDDLSFIDSSRARSVDNTPPVDFFQDCMIAYDYSGKRLLFMKPSSSIQEFGWQYDLDNMKWQQIDFAGAKQVVNVYPFSYIQQVNDAVNVIKKLELPYNYSRNKTVSGILVTRPLKLDSLQLKTVSQIRLEGNFSKLQRLWLYGSNNLIDWFFIGATSNKRMLLRGRSFKFFRIAINSELYHNENISGCRIIYTVKPEYRLR